MGTDPATTAKADQVRAMLRNNGAPRAELADTPDEVLVELDGAVTDTLSPLLRLAARAAASPPDTGPRLALLDHVEDMPVEELRIAVVLLAMGAVGMAAPPPDH